MSLLALLTLLGVFTLTPEQRSIRAKIAAHTRWAGNEDRKANAVRAQNGLRAKFVREARAKWPDLAELEIEHRAEHAYLAHMQRLALKSSKARTAREKSGGDRDAT
jgi:hypothetical protein